jgi:hypothetical protein
MDNVQENIVIIKKIIPGKGVSLKKSERFNMCG